jgi:hypothetical protein
VALLPSLAEMPDLIREIEEGLSEQLKRPEMTSPFREGNTRLIQELKAEFGHEIIEKVWERVHPERQAALLEGKEDLLEYSDSFRQKAIDVQHAHFVEGVIQKYPECFDRLKTEFSEPVAKKTFRLISTTVLLQFLSEETSPAVHMDAIREKARRLHTVVEYNKHVIGELESKFSKEIVRLAVSEFSSAQIIQIREGSLRLDPSELTARCETISHKVFETSISPKFTTLGQVPNESDLCEFFATARLVKFCPATQGAFFFEGTLKGSPLTLVVKVPEKIRQETFGTQVLSLAGIKTPDLKNISMGSPIADLITQSIAASRNREAIRAFHPDAGSTLSIMTFIEGKTLESVQQQDVRATLERDPSSVARLLHEIGEVGGADFLLFYRDRLPILSPGNMENLMVSISDGMLRSAIAIDQPAYFSSNDFFCRFMGFDPHAILRSRIEDIFSDKDPTAVQTPAVRDTDSDSEDDDETAPISTAEMLWESLVCFHGLVEKEEGIRHLQAGLRSGLSKITALTPEQLRIIFLNLLPQVEERDTLDLEAHLAVLHTIKTHVPS